MNKHIKLIITTVFVFHPTDIDKVGCDGMYLESSEMETVEDAPPELLPLHGVTPGFIPSVYDIEHGTFRLEWSRPKEFIRLYGESKYELAEKWNKLARSVEDL